MINLDYVRSQIIGIDLLLKTPFGDRNMLYADYTASGRGLAFIEEKILNIQKSYANSHTEGSYSGNFATKMVHLAEERIKKVVNAGEHGKIVFTGTGSTGALERLQKIIGVYLPPASWERIYNSLSPTERLKIENSRPVVFLGSYEHHSNEIMWRESMAEVVVIKLNNEGLFDLKDLEKKISDEKYAQRVKFASFSAGSNVTGIKTDTYSIARICHEYNTRVFFDFAAVAPYIEIDMNKDEHSYFDAIFFSPHKFLGGPGTTGVLIFNENIYNKDLPPTTAGGGTVDYVGFYNIDYTKDIEAREKPGTPGILQIIRTALVLEAKEKIGLSVIKEKELQYTQLFFDRFRDNENLLILGNLDPKNRIPIISFNIKHEDRILHPSFVTKLLNDLFGIQSRSGCNCAGPYGHLLLDIDDDLSQQYRKLINQGFDGFKPGWVRINLHYSFTEDDVEFLVQAIEFIIQYGYLFIQKYAFNRVTGDWSYMGFKEDPVNLSLENSFKPQAANLKEIKVLRQSYLRDAKEIASQVEKSGFKPFLKDRQDMEELKYFYYVNK
jgi:selenocysteine lyase/cysteine desulfurase